MEWSEGDVTVGGVRLHYYRRGSGQPVVLAHGFSDNGKCWERVATVLDHRYDVIAYDARYHGKSDVPESSTFTTGADLVGLVEALRLENPSVIGHSMGAMSVAEAVGLKPELFCCAVLEDPPWRDSIPQQIAGVGAPTGPKSQTVEEILAAGKQQSPMWHDDEFPAWAESKLQLRVPDDWRARRASGLGQWRDTARAIGVPTLLVRGGNVARGRIVDDTVAAEAQQLNPLIDSVCLAKAGHNIRREAFREFVAAVNAFLARHS